jgi:hypothetical protein
MNARRHRLPATIAAACALTGLLIVAAVNASRAQTTADRAACKQDALHFCAACVPAWLIGEHDCMHRCMDTHKASLSKACRRVLQKYGY